MSDLSVGHLIAAVFAESADAVLVVDESGRIALASAAVRPLFGYYPEELAGEPIEVLVPAALRDEHERLRRRFSGAPERRQMGSGLQLFGLTRSGEQIPIDVSLNPTEVDGRRYVAAFVRDATARLRALRQSETVAEVSELLLAGAGEEETISLVLVRARALVGATASWLVVPAPDGELLVRAADGEDSGKLLGERLSARSSRSAEVIASGRSQVLADLAGAGNVPSAAEELRLGPAIYVPFRTGDDRPGVLVVARAGDAAPYGEFEVRLVELFAGAVSVTLSLGDARRQLEHLREVEERERIARDLHDTIIQRAFAVGMSLQAVRPLASGPLGEHLDAAVQSLDEMIRDLRATIFNLSHKRRSPSLGQELSELAGELSRQLGFEPELSLTIAERVELPGELAGELKAVLREALSNVARHAAATSASVSVIVEPSAVKLSVRDDGVGIAAGAQMGNGLANLAERARRRGGSFAARPREPAGTVLTWSVPIE